VVVGVELHIIDSAFNLLEVLAWRLGSALGASDLIEVSGQVLLRGILSSLCFQPSGDVVPDGGDFSLVLGR